LDSTELSKKAIVKDFKSILFSYGARTIIDQPTRICKTKNGYLDNAVTNIPKTLIKSINVYDPAISDHCIQVVKLFNQRKLESSQHVNF